MYKILFIILTIIFSVGFIYEVDAKPIPDWVKNTAGWWATDAISEKEFVSAIEFLINGGIITVSTTSSDKSNEGVPDWVKNTAGWWATDAISEKEFVSAIEYLISIRVIDFQLNETAKQLAGMWKNGEISDDKFLEQVRKIDEGMYFLKGENSEIPEWLSNNAGWVYARVLTDSDYLFNQDYTKEEIFPCEIGSVGFDSCNNVKNNSHGLRGLEFNKNKQNDVYRIIAIGGSTTWGSGESNDKLTWPGHLQKIIEHETENKVEVINAGISGFNSENEYAMIRDKLVNYNPDLIIMYDGYNDHQNTKIQDTIENWKNVCKLGQDKQFDTIIIVQPLPIGTYRVLTEQEIVNSDFILQYPRVSQEYVENFPILEKDCNDVFDFRYIFDYVQEPIFWDRDHSKSNGNFIIAENVFENISSKYLDIEYVIERTKPPYQNEDASVRSDIYSVGANLKNRNFDEMDLQYAVFDYANLEGGSFKNSDIKNARFYWASLSGVDLSGKDLTGTKLRGADLSNTILENVDLSGKDLTGTILQNVDLSGKDLTGTKLRGADLSNTILENVDLSGKDLTGTILQNVDLSGKDLTGTKLRGADLSNVNLNNVELSGKDLSNVNLSNVDLSGKDLRNVQLGGVIAIGSDFDNTNLSGAQIIEVNLTKIKNSSFKNSNLEGASFAQSNLTGLELPKMIVKNNFNHSIMHNIDFSNKIIEQSVFGYAELTNSNFENVLGSQILKTYKIENLGLLNLAPDEFIMTYWGTPTVTIINLQLFDDYFVVDVLEYIDLSNSNLENSNFKNSNFSGANFSGANLVNANLEGANLEGAYFTNANLEGANLNCINHLICN